MIKFVVTAIAWEITSSLVHKGVSRGLAKGRRQAFSMDGTFKQLADTKELSGKTKAYMWI